MIRLVMVVVVVFVSTTRATAQRPAFDHEQHAGLFPACASCHAGAVREGRAMWPEPASCAACHDGTIEDVVRWEPPAQPRRSNLRFSHAGHDRLVAQRRAATGEPETFTCTDCHAPAGARWMTVTAAAPDARCITCHRGLAAAHLEVPDSACATCHVTLAQAARLTRADVAEFPAPPSHEVPGFALEGHGAAAEASMVSCATCHAREFCVQCHVDAPEQRVIQRLASDPRSLALAAHPPTPRSHADPAFLRGHGAAVRRNPADCATCHTQESCFACHLATPRVAAALHAAGPDRGPGARITRRPPPSHEAGYADRHRVAAATAPTTCAGCHARAQCLDCHRPSAAAAPAYHAAGFLIRHPAAAYARETECSDCHDGRAFCADCHAAAGVVSARTLRGGYHDAKNFFLVGHGQAARQSLETCVTCHAERDCLPCHSALGGRRFSPHGPGFDAERLRRRNPEMCTACHGAAIPN